MEGTVVRWGRGNEKPSVGGGTEEHGDEHDDEHDSGTDEARGGAR